MNLQLDTVVNIKKGVNRRKWKAHEEFHVNQLCLAPNHLHGQKAG